MDCESLIQLLSEYLDDELDFDIEQELEEHLSECPFCDPVYHSMIKTLLWVCSDLEQTRLTAISEILRYGHQRPLPIQPLSGLRLRLLNSLYL